MTNNYISVVIIGNFNPSILTHKFLAAECGLDLSKEPIQKTPPVPVFSSLAYDNISFFADLSRLEIKEERCKDPKQSKIPEYIAAYLDRLPHTPITKCGANFSYNVNLKQSQLDNIDKILTTDRQYFLRTLNIDEIQLDTVFNISRQSETAKKWILRTAQAVGASTSMTVKRLEDSKIKLDFNYEVDHEQIKNITDAYAEIYDLFLFQFHKIFKETKS